MTKKEDILPKFHQKSDEVKDDVDKVLWMIEEEIKERKQPTKTKSECDWCFTICFFLFIGLLVFLGYSFYSLGYKHGVLLQDTYFRNISKLAFDENERVCGTLSRCRAKVDMLSEIIEKNLNLEDNTILKMVVEGKFDSMMPQLETPGNKTSLVDKINNANVN